MEILLSLLVLAVGLMGVLVLFPLGIDAARISAETTRSATIARLAKAELFYVNGSAPNCRSPFQRILEDIRNPSSAPAYRQRGPWLLPHFDEVLDPNADVDTTDNGPEVQPVLTSGVTLPTAEYGWSMTVAYPYNLVTNPSPPPPYIYSPNPPYSYVLNGLWQNERVFIVQVTVYRRFSSIGGRGNFAQNGIVIDNLNLTGTSLDSVRGGDWVRYLDVSTTPYSGDGFWYQVDQVDALGRRVKLSERYWGREGNNVRLEVSDRVLGTYTFLLSAE